MKAIYLMAGGNLSAFEMVNRFWKIMCFGGYATHGETYMEKMSDDQILWWSKGGNSERRKHSKNPFFYVR